MAFQTSLIRDRACVENGQTGFALRLGYETWHIELSTLAVLVDAQTLQILAQLPVEHEVAFCLTEQVMPKTEQVVEELVG